MSYLLYILLGIAPSMIWLSYYLRKDVHPEPKKLILKVFILGIGAAGLACLVENLISNSLVKLNWAGPYAQILYIFLGVALVEETLKYMAVEKKYVIFKNGIIRDSECDEPTDLMIYMIISALGFAALENILIFSVKNMVFFETVLVASLRFIGATFLHALCSGTFGFFIALSFLKPKKKLYLLAFGLIIATVLHGLFNYSIMKIEQSMAIQNGSIMINNSDLFLISILTPIAILLGLSLFVSLGFKKLRKIKSVCLS